MLWVAPLLLAHIKALVDVDLFIGGEGGYSCYRLPNLVQMPKPGHLLAIVQGHKYDCNDNGRMDVLVRRSVDYGRSWTAPSLVYTESNATSNVTIGTPTAVVDVETNTVHVLVCRNFKHVLLLSSTDEGTTWRGPVDLTASLVPDDWSGVFTGLPQGIQLLPLATGAQKRLIVCANHLLNTSVHPEGGGHSHTIFSDNGGVTWENGEAVNPSHMGECSLAQLNGRPGEIVMYARVWWDDASNKSTRALSFSNDNGKTFTQGNVSAFPGNPGSDSQGAIIAAGTQLFVGSPWGSKHFPRQNYTVLMSSINVVAKEMPTWTPMPGADPLWSGPAAYSTMLLPSSNSSTASQTFFVLYERGVHNENEVLHLTELQVPSR